MVGKSITLNFDCLKLFETIKTRASSVLLDISQTIDIAQIIGTKMLAEGQTKLLHTAREQAAPPVGATREAPVAVAR